MRGAPLRRAEVHIRQAPKRMLPKGFFCLFTFRTDGVGVSGFQIQAEGGREVRPCFRSSSWITGTDRRQVTLGVTREALFCYMSLDPAGA